MSDDQLRAEKLAAMGRLASIIGHEIRNPLSSIKNTLWLIGDSLKGIPLPEKDKGLPDFVAFADREVDSIVKIIADLLDFARTDKLFFEPTNVNGAAQDVLKTLSVPDNVRIEERYEPSIPTIQADAIKIRQAFLRLATNAIEAMPQGGTLEIATFLRKEPTGTRIAVSFKDSGTGIAPEHRPKLFEPFFSTKQNRVGLGLVIASSVAKSHGGDVSVESDVGRGSTFTFTLPAPR
jgi:signal transduction histidine kinase